MARVSWRTGRFTSGRAPLLRKWQDFDHRWAYNQSRDREGAGAFRIRAAHDSKRSTVLGAASSSENGAVPADSEKFDGLMAQDTGRNRALQGEKGENVPCVPDFRTFNIGTV